MKMQKVQPLVNAIKKKYEKYSMKDPRKAEMNKEIAAIFKENKVNPAGRLLPPDHPVAVPVGLLHHAERGH